MAQRKSVKLSTRPAHATAAANRGETSAVGGDFIPADAPLTVAAPEARSEPDYGLLGQAMYGTVYALSFGCVFSAMLLSRFLPGQEILARGIGDGARAAKLAAAGIGTHAHEVGGCERDIGVGNKNLRPA